MEIRLFHEFLLLAKQLNFSRAAEQLGMTQPVLSRHIKYLEEQFGAQLLDRNTHKVELTPAGELLAEEAAKLIAQYESTFLTIQASVGKSRQKLSIAFLGEATREILSSFLGEFRKRHAAITVECCDTEIDSIPGALDSRQADLAFVVRPNSVNEGDGLERLHLFCDPLCVAVRDDHPLALRETISIREVANWPLIGVNRRSAPLAGECNAHFLERHGLGYKPTIECANLSTCCFTLELQDNAVVVLPMHRRDLLGPNAVLLAVAEEDCQYNVELVWGANNRNPCIGTFLKEFKEFSAHRDWGAKTFGRPPISGLPRSRGIAAFAADPSSDMRPR
ncbi:LysR family transcriptional regulator [Consotaella aegiceratis]|uniref:LysR family transcriptional regulator n=1 Tax=Consotaella aegiceratis TaxID=3097961 RepID=UPI002F3F9567